MDRAPRTPTGLSVADATRLHRKLGPNQVASGREAPSVLTILTRQLRNPLLLLLAVAAGSAWYLGESLDAWIIVAALGLAVLLGFAQEYKAEGTLAALNRLVAPMAWVLRDGTRQQILATHIVPGDVLVLSAGDKVSADALIERNDGLEVSEASLTGESAAIIKADGDTVFAGTVVLRGQALAVVTAIGQATKMGQIASLVARTDEEETPLELRIRAFSRQLAAGIALLILLLVALSLWQGRPFDTTFLLAISLAVAVIPEGLPIMVTLVLAIGMERLARQHATVRRMAAVEALGSVTVAAIDKTGTMTTGELAVAEVIGENPETVLTGALLASQVGAAALIGTPDPLETALVVATELHGVELETVERRFTRIRTIQFDARHRWMATVVQHGRSTTTFIKGAPEVLLEHCTLSAARKQTVSRLVQKRAKQGERVLLIARARGALEGRDLPSDLTYLGLITFNDPLRPAAREAVAALIQRGIRLIMITGDHPGTAQATAKQLGLSVPQAAVLTGEVVRSFTTDELAHRLKTTTVCARILPEQKLAIVAALQQAGEVVAMTGDGVNDGPALKKADIGIALGKSGTEVAKETADLVLLDDELTTLVSAVDGGRRILATLEKGIIFLLGTNLAELLAVTGATAFGWPLPLAATQILWVNLVSDSVPVVGLALEHHSPGNAPPPRRRAILDAFGWRRITVLGVLMAAVTPGFYWLANPNLIDASNEHILGQTLAFTALAVGQLALILTVRSRRELRWPWRFPNPVLLAMIAGGIALQVAVVQQAGEWLHVVPLDALSWLLIGLVLSAVLVFVEFHKELDRWLSQAKRRRRAPIEQAFTDVSQGLARPLAYYRRWRYKNTALLIASVTFFVYFLDSEFIQASLRGVGSLGYLGAFLSGIFFTSAFTVAPASVSLYALADTLNPYWVALLAGAGSVIGDYVILRILKDRLFTEIAPLAKRYGGSFLRTLFRTPYFAWALPFVGAAFIASPLPDEVGIGLMGLSRIKTWQFLAITFALNTLGIFLIVSVARLL